MGESPSDSPPDVQQTYNNSTRQFEDFPPLNRPRVWFLTRGSSAVGVEVARRLLAHGDWVMAGLGIEDVEREKEEDEDWKEFLSAGEEAELAFEKTRISHKRRRGQGHGDQNDFHADEIEDGDDDVEDDDMYDDAEDQANDGQPTAGRSGRFKVYRFDGRSMASCQAAIAETVNVYGQLDVLLCCHSEALLGTIEELSATALTQSLVTTQFSSNLFTTVNLIKSALPTLRRQRRGHIILLSSVAGHLGTPGLAAFCASQWAVEGYCDSIAYEIAPFGVRVSIVQANIEVGLLTGTITAAPEMGEYSPPQNTAPLARRWLGGLVDRLDNTGPPNSRAPTADEHKVKTSDLLHDRHHYNTFQLKLSSSFKIALVAETVQALLAIGGHENPPARHIVGHEAVASVKEKLRTVSEEMEDFLECSSAVDF